MAYINLDNNAYPTTERDIRLANPNTSFPTPFVPPETYAWVFPTPQPTFNAITELCREIAPELLNGKYYQAWEVVALEPEQIAANLATKQASLIQSITAATQARLDDFAKTRNYDGILSACTYATSPTLKFATEGQYCVAARDNTWATLYTIMSEVEAQTRSMPSGYNDIAADLPALAWPN